MQREVEDECSDAHRHCVRHPNADVVEDARTVAVVAAGRHSLDLGLVVGRETRAGGYEELDKMITPYQMSLGYAK